MTTPNAPSPTATATPEQIKERLNALLDVVIDKSKLNKAFLPVIKNLAKNFLTDVSPDDLRGGILELRDKYIPWILGEVSNENPSSQ